MRDPHKDVEHGGGGHYTEIGPLNEEAVRSHDYGWNRAFDNLERTL